jgi:hypothetical protein
LKKGKSNLVCEETSLREKPIPVGKPTSPDVEQTPKPMSGSTNKPKVLPKRTRPTRWLKNVAKQLKEVDLESIIPIKAKPWLKCSHKTVGLALYLDTCTDANLMDENCWERIRATYPALKMVPSETKMKAAGSTKLVIKGRVVLQITFPQDSFALSALFLVVEKLGVDALLGIHTMRKHSLSVLNEPEGSMIKYPNGLWPSEPEEAQDVLGAYVCLMDDEITEAINASEAPKQNHHFVTREEAKGLNSQ